MPIQRTNRNKAAEIATQLTNDQIVYLYIAESIWSSTDAFAEDIIVDVEDSGGVFNPAFNSISLDFSGQRFNNLAVEDTVDLWHGLVDYGGEYLRGDMSNLEVLDHILFNGATIESFQNVEVNIIGSTGSYAYPSRNEDKVSIQDILSYVDVENVVRNFLAIDEE